MKLQFDNLIYDVTSLARCVTAIDYDTANSFLQFNDQLPLTPGKWHRVIYDDKVGYIFISADGNSGRYSRGLPDVEDKGDIVDVKYKFDPGYGRNLINELLKLIEIFLHGNKCKIASSSDEIELINSDSQQLKNLKDLLIITMNCIQPTYNAHIVNKVSNNIGQKILSEYSRGFETLNQILTEETDKIAELRKMCGANGILSAWFMFYRDICYKAYSYVNDLKDQEQAYKVFITYLDYGSRRMISDPLVLLDGTVQKTVHQGLSLLSESLADLYLRRGEHFIEQSLESKTREYHNANLYTAALFLEASDRIFRNLIITTKGDKVHNPRYCKGQKVSEEKLVRVMSALIHAVNDRTGERFTFHRTIINELLHKKDESGASNKIFELIEMYYFYPRYFDSQLRNSN